MSDNVKPKQSVANEGETGRTRNVRGADTRSSKTLIYTTADSLRFRTYITIFCHAIKLYTNKLAKQKQKYTRIMYTLVIITRVY